MGEGSSFEKVGECLYRNSSSGTYYALVKVRGKQIKRSLRTEVLAEARRKLRDFKADIGRIDHSKSKNTLAHYADAYFASCQSRSPKALKNKKRVVDLIKSDWPGGSNVPVAEVNASDIRKFLTAVTAGAGWSYYNSILGIVRNVFLAAFEDNAITEIPGERGVKKKDSVWKRRSVKDAVRLVPSVVQFRQIVDNIRAQPFSDTREETADFVEAEGTLGLGQAELANMEWQHVHFDNGTLTVLRIKTGQPFTIPLFPTARPMLERRWKNAHKDGRPPAPTDKVFSIKDAKVAVSAACRRLGLPQFSQRSFRRMFITEALRAGVNVKVIADLQGHRDGGKLILKTYSAAIAEADRKDAAKLIARAFEQPESVIPMEGTA